SGFRRCLGCAIFFAGVVAAPSARRALAQADNSISSLSTNSGPGDSTPAADYVRRQTEPPRFDPNSPAAQAERAKAPPPPKAARPPSSPGSGSQPARESSTNGKGTKGNGTKGTGSSANPAAAPTRRSRETAQATPNPFGTPPPGPATGPFVPPGPPPAPQTPP